MRISGERLGELGSVLFKGSLSFTTCVTTFPIFCVLCTHDRLCIATQEVGKHTVPIWLWFTGRMDYLCTCTAPTSAVAW